MLSIAPASLSFASLPGSCPADLSPPLSGVMQSTDKAKILLAYDMWSPYIYVDEGLASSTGDVTGFGIEFVKLMQASTEPECGPHRQMWPQLPPQLVGGHDSPRRQGTRPIWASLSSVQYHLGEPVVCTVARVSGHRVAATAWCLHPFPHPGLRICRCAVLDIAMVQDQWGRMWYDASDGTKLGDGTNMGIYHAGMTYTHLKGVRPRMGEFSIAITKPTAQPAGLLVKLDSDGNPMVDPASSLTGETIVDVVGYAPTTDTFSVVQNWCNDPPTYFDAAGVTFLLPETEGNAAAMALFKSSDANLMYVYADQANDCIGAAYSGDCAGWEGFGTEYAYLHGGLSSNINGTTIGFGKMHSGLKDLMDPCIDVVMKTEEYYEICKAPLRPPDQMDTNLAVCYPNSFWTDEDMASADTHVLYSNQAQRTADDGHSCATGYCTCSEMPSRRK